MIYYYFRYSLIHPDFVSPTERTLTQQKLGQYAADQEQSCRRQYHIVRCVP